MPDTPLDALLAALDHAEHAPRDESGRLTSEAQDEVRQLAEYAESLADKGEDEPPDIDTMSS